MNHSRFSQPASRLVKPGRRRRPQPRTSAGALLLPVVLLAGGCGLTNGPTGSVKGASLQGQVHGGKQPVANATIQLYAAGNGGVASASTPLLPQSLVSGGDGSFSIGAGYTCPSASTPVYLVSTGGNPGLYRGGNSSIVLMAALGACGDLGQVSTVTLNEVSTVTAIFSLAPFMQSYARIGADSTLVGQFAGAWAQAAQLTDVSTGAAAIAPAISAPALASSTPDSAVMATRINTLANILAVCVNSGGGIAGDGSRCGELFSLTSSGGTVPSDTATAVLQIARNPALHASELFGLLSPISPYTPQLASAPAGWGLVSAAGLPLLSSGSSTSSDAAGGLPVIPPVVPPPVAPVIPPVVPPPVVTVIPPVVPQPIPPVTLTLSNATLEVGRIGAGTLTLNNPAPSGGLSFTVTSSAAGVLSLPQAVSIAAGQSSAKFFDTALAAGATQIGVSASGYGSASAALLTQLPVAQMTLFGLTVHDNLNVTPQLSFATARTWDAAPGANWADANPAPGVYDFSALNTLIAINQARGAELVYTFGRTPQWASTSPNTQGYYFPGQCGAPILSAWDDYVTAVATAAAGRIHYWELWNEPDFPGTWCSDIPTFVTLAQHAYRIIKTIDPTAKVLSPATSGGDGASWMANFLNQGGKGTFDIVAFHGYEGTVAEAIRPIVSVYRNAMHAFGIDELPLWDTECSWGDNPIGDDAHRAAFLAKYFVLQWSDGVDRTLWYAYDGLPGWGRLVDANFNLLPDGVAYAQVQSWMLGATLTQPCAADSNGTWTCGISRPGGYTGQILWNSSRTATGVAIPAGMTRFRDLSGNAVPFYGGTISLGNMPLLFETGAP